MKKIVIKVFIASILLLFLGVGFVSALEINYPNIPGVEEPQDFINNSEPGDIVLLYVVYFLNLGFWASGIIAMGALMYAGFLYLTSAGNVDKMLNARQRITAALVGLAIVFSSVILLDMLDPDLTNLRLPNLTKVNIYVPPDVELPGDNKESSVDIEMPIGRVIESIFETSIASYPKTEDIIGSFQVFGDIVDIPPSFSSPSDDEEEVKIPRMQRIDDLVRELSNYTISNNRQKDGIIDRMANQSVSLANLSRSCKCRQTDPNTGCGWKGCGGCSPSKCVNDACKNVRSQIINTEQKNLAVLDELIVWQQKAKDEVLELKSWLNRLERGEQFIAECPFGSLTSWSEQTNKKTFFDNKGWLLTRPGFWDDLNSIYKKEGETRTSIDYATFYCAKGGSTNQEINIDIFSAPPGFGEFGGGSGGSFGGGGASGSFDLPDDISAEEFEDLFSNKRACSQEAPLGEIIDRTKRTTKLLIWKLEKIIDETKNLTEKIDRTQTAISTCTNRFCVPICVCINTTFGNFCIKIGCFGISCPLKSKINSNKRDIITIWQRIKDHINKIETSTKPLTPKDIGVINIINDLAPSIVNDLEVYIRRPMKNFTGGSWAEKSALLFRASNLSEGSLIPPGGKTFTEIGLIEEVVNGVKKDTDYGFCFEQCYLKQGLNSHRACLNSCFIKKVLAGGNPDIVNYVPKTNFYYCNL